MTYNFDPDRWFEMQRDALDQLYKNGKLTQKEYEKRCDELTEEYYRMLDRLDIRHDY